MPPRKWKISPKLLKKNTIWRSRDTAIYSTIISQVDASNLGRNISKTAPNKTQFGAQENKQNVKKFIPGRCLHAGEKYSPKQLQKNHRLEILRTSLYSTIVSLGDASKLGRNISKTAKKTNNSEIQRSSHLYTKEMPASWREISPKLFQRNLSLEILRTSHLFNNCTPGRCLHAREKYLQNCSKRNKIVRSRQKAIPSIPRRCLQAISKTAPKTQFDFWRYSNKNIQWSTPGRCP